MRVPIRHIHGHLVWSTSGAVWAFWRLQPIGSRYAPALEREEILARVTSLVRSLEGTARLYSLCASVDPGEVALRMTDGVDTHRFPAAAETAHATLEMLDGAEMHRRTLWLALPLRVGDRGAQLAAMANSAWAQLGESVGEPAPPVSLEEVRAYRAAAAQVEASFGGGLTMRRARPAEIVWIHEHSVRRGMGEPLLMEAETSGLRGGRMLNNVLRSPSYADLGQVRLQEGGQSTSPAVVRGVRSLVQKVVGAAFNRLWLEVETEEGFGYQAHLALTEIPKRVAAKSADVLAQLEQLDYPVDAVIDLNIIDGAKARQQIAKKKRELIDQAEQWSAHPDGTPNSLFGSADELGEEESLLAATSVEREVQSVTVLSVWGADPRECDRRARDIKAQLAGVNYKVVRPRGSQARLFEFGLPGAGPATRVREYTQFQLTEDWAMGGALTGGDIGDATGPMVGISRDTGTFRAVLIDLANAVKRNVSASLGVIGDLGSGKSVLLKLLTIGLVDRGHRAIVVDRTPLREWARFARDAAPGRCQVIDAAEAKLSLDPFRVLPAGMGEHAAFSYLTLQLNVAPMTVAGSVLNRAVKAAARAERPAMARVMEELEVLAAEPGPRGQEATGVLDMLRIVSEAELARLVFDESLPALSLSGDLDADLVVITTAGLTLPPKEALGNPDILRAQPLEAQIGRAVLYLIAAVARQVAFTDQKRFAALVMDECYWLTSSHEGHALVSEVVHDGRKHRAGVLLGGHDADDLGDETVRGLLAYRFLARTSDPVLAKKGLAFLGQSTDDEQAVRIVTSGLSPVGVVGREGEMLLRDSSRQIGRIQVVITPVARIQSGIGTTPTDEPSRRPAARRAPAGPGRRPASGGRGLGGKRTSLTKTKNEEVAK
ncbi:ATP-binding protein [Kitasatospora sp. NPDC059088]|uniref:ATP-binding protein n=1 Tax=Kitasatospora sp. NPDC059088 TaxID=3346722 RepID=UPI0036CDA895